MIKGIGIDLVENSRMKKIYDQYGDRFLNKILDKSEIEEFNNHHNISFLSKRFACKEALSKSLGVGLYRENLYPKTIRIDHDSNGKPYFVLTNSILNIIKKLDVDNIFLSISDTNEYSTAVVIAEKK